MTDTDPSQMVGGNPKKDAYGFRYWRDPGPLGTVSWATGDLGHFEGFLGALWAASFCIVGPEYISMVSGEAKRPRVYIKNAFKTVYFRFGAFFILGALCVGIVLPYNDPTLVQVLTSGEKSAAASPYVIAMTNLNINGLPLEASRATGSRSLSCASVSFVDDVRPLELALLGKTRRTLELNGFR